MKVLSAIQDNDDLVNKKYVDDKVATVDTALTEHEGDTTAHVTAEEKVAWDAKAEKAFVVHFNEDPDAQSGYAADHTCAEVVDAYRAGLQITGAFEWSGHSDSYPLSNIEFTFGADGAVDYASISFESVNVYDENHWFATAVTGGKFKMQLQNGVESLSSETSTVYGTMDDYGAVGKSGDTMLGPLTLPGAPTETLHAATKGYVDEAKAAAQAASRPSTWMPTAAQVGADPAGSAATVNTALNTHANNGNIHVTAAEKATWDGKADLVDGVVPSSQLPSYVDDVLEYASISAFPATGESGKVYVTLDTNKTYRWSGTGYTEIAQGVALGETAATAYRGDRGKIAYDHSQNADVHVTAAQKTAWDAKVDQSYVDNKVKTDVPEGAVFTDTVYTHPATHDLAMITDLSSDNVFTGDHKMNGLLYFKNNEITNISSVYKTGLYGVTNADTTTPYKGFWMVAVFCKDEGNQIAVQWAMPVNIVGNGELWMRTVRLNAASTGDGNYIGPWQRVLHQTLADSLYQSKLTFDTIPTAGSTNPVTSGGVADALGSISPNPYIAADTEPTNTGILWIDTGNGGVMKYHNGTEWVAVGAAWG